MRPLTRAAQFALVGAAVAALLVPEPAFAQARRHWDTPPPAEAADTEVKPYADAAAVRARGEGEARVWSEAGDLDRAIRRNGALYGDATLDAYLQGILDRLFPEFSGVLRVRVVNAPDLNAFALPNGSLYVNMGMLARLEDEAQLATVLGHEGAHFVHRHGYQHRETAKSSSGFALVLGVVGGLGGAILGNIVALNAIYGYSRDHEREADRIGFERIVAQGYDTASAPRVFELLDEEAKVLALPEPVFFASHPRLEERIASYRELSAKRPPAGGTLGREAYLAATRKVRADWPRAEIERGKAKSVIHVLSDPKRRERYPHPDFWLGEAYRVRGDADDAKLAVEALERAIAADAAHAPAWRALGLMRMKVGEPAEAARLFRRYLELAPQAGDADFVRQYLAELEKPAAAPAAAQAATSPKDDVK